MPKTISLLDFEEDPTGVKPKVDSDSTVSVGNKLPAIEREPDVAGLGFGSEEEEIIEDRDFPSPFQNAMKELDGYAQGKPVRQFTKDEENQTYYNSLVKAVFDVSPILINPEHAKHLASIDPTPINVTRKILDDAYRSRKSESTNTFKTFLRDVLATVTPQSIGPKSSEEEESERNGVRMAVEAMGGYTKAKEFFEKKGQSFPANPVLLTPEGRYLRELQKEYGTERGANVFLSMYVPRWARVEKEATKTSTEMMDEGLAKRAFLGVGGVTASGFMSFAVRPIRGLAQFGLKMAGDKVSAAEMGVPFEIESTVERIHEMNKEWYGNLPKKDFFDRTMNKLGQMSYEIGKGSMEAAGFCASVQAVTGAGYGAALGQGARTVEFAVATTKQSAKFFLYKCITEPGNTQERLVGGFLAFIYNMTPVASRELGGVVGQITNSKSLGRVSTFLTDVAQNMGISEASSKLYSEATKQGYQEARSSGLSVAESLSWALYRGLGVCPGDVLPSVGVLAKNVQTRVTNEIPRVENPELRQQEKIVEEGVRMAVKTTPTIEEAQKLAPILEKIFPEKPVPTEGVETPIREATPGTKEFIRAEADVVKAYQKIYGIDPLQAIKEQDGVILKEIQEGNARATPEEKARAWHDKAVEQKLIPPPLPAKPMKPQVAYEEGTGPAAPRTSLPKELSGAKPRYSYQQNRFNVEFDSDIDKAAYICAQTKKSKRDSDYLKFAMDATGMTAVQVRELGEGIRGTIKKMASEESQKGMSPEGKTLKVKAQYKAEEETPAAPAPVLAPVAEETPLEKSEKEIRQITLYENSGMKKKELYAKFNVKNKAEYEKFREDAFNRHDQLYIEKVKQEKGQPPAPGEKAPEAAQPPAKPVSNTIQAQVKAIGGTIKKHKQFAQNAEWVVMVGEKEYRFSTQYNPEAAKWWYYIPKRGKIPGEGDWKVAGEFPNEFIPKIFAGAKPPVVAPAPAPVEGAPIAAVKGTIPGPFYHGSRSDTRFAEAEMEPGMDGLIYFSTDKEYAKGYIDPLGEGGGRAGLYEAREVVINNPKIFDGRDDKQFEDFVGREINLSEDQDGAILMMPSEDGKSMVIDNVAVRDRGQIVFSTTAQKPPKPMDDGTSRPQTLDELTRLMEEISPGEMSEEKAVALASLVRGVAAYKGLTPDEYVRQRFAGLFMGGEPTMETLYKKLGAKEKNFIAMEEYFSKHITTKDDTAYYDKVIKFFTGVSTRPAGETALRGNQKTILSIDVSSDCPLREMGLACLECYVENPRLALLGKVDNYIKKNMPNVKLGMMEINADNIVRYQDSGEWKDFGTQAQTIKTLRDSGIIIGAQTPSKVFRHVPFNEKDFAEMPQPFVDFLNSTGGLRVNSNGDFKNADVATFDKIVKAAGKRGLNLKIITKQLGCVERYAGNRHVSFNLSAQFWPDFALSHRRTLEKHKANIPTAGGSKESAIDRATSAIEFGVLDTGFHRDVATSFKKKYPRQVRIRYVAMNRDEFIMAANDKDIDVVTMYHGPTDAKSLFSYWRSSLAHENWFKHPNDGGMGIDDNAAMALASIFEATKPKSLVSHGITQKEIDAALGPGKLTESKLVELAEKKVCCRDGACGRCTVLCGFASEKRVKDGLKVLGKLVDGNAKASVEFDSDNRAIIRAFGATNVADMAHELGHIFRRDLALEDLNKVEEWAGVGEDGVWSRSAEEKFATGFERYLAEGSAPTPLLKGVFAKFKDWMVEIYGSITKSSIELNITPEVKDVFDRLLSGTRPTERLDTPPQLTAKEYDALANKPGMGHEERWLGGKGGWYDEKGVFRIGEPTRGDLYSIRQEMTPEQRASESPSTTWERYYDEYIDTKQQAPPESDALEQGKDEHDRVTLGGTMDVLYKQKEVSESIESNRPDVRMLGSLGYKVSGIKLNARRDSAYIDIQPTGERSDAGQIRIRFSDHPASEHTFSRFNHDVEIEIGKDKAQDPSMIEKSLRKEENIRKIRKVVGDKIAVNRVIKKLNEEKVPERQRGGWNRFLEWMGYSAQTDPAHPVADKYMRYRLLQMPMQHLLRILERNGFQRSSKGLSWIHEEFFQARKIETKVMRVVTEELEANFKMPEEYNSEKVEHMVKVRGQGEYTKLEIMSLFMMSKDKTNRKNMTEHGVRTRRYETGKPVKFTDEMLADVEAYVLGDKYLFPASQSLKRVLPWLAEKENVVSMKSMGREIAKNKDYWMAQRDEKGIVREWDSITGPSDMANATRIVSIYHQSGNLQARKGTGGVVFVQNPVDAINKYTRAAARYIALSETIDNIRSVIKSTNFLDYMSRHYPADVVKTIEEYVDDMEAGGVKRSGRWTEKWVYPLFNWLNDRIVSAGLKFSPRAASYQVVAIAPAYYVVPEKYFLSGIKKVPESMSHMSKYSDMCWARFRESSSMVGEFYSEAAQPRKFGWEMIRGLDAASLGQVWNMTRDEVRDLNPSLKGDELEYAVGELHYWRIAMSQPTQNPEDKPSMARTPNPLTRAMFVLFSSQKNVNYGLYSLHRSDMLDRHDRGDYSGPEGGKLIKEDVRKAVIGRLVPQAAIAVLGTLGTAVTMAFLKSLNIYYDENEDEKTFASTFTKNFFVNVIGDMGMIPSFLSRIFSGFNVNPASQEVIAKLKRLNEAMGLESGERTRDDKYGLRGTDKSDHVYPTQIYSASQFLNLATGSGLLNLIVQAGGLFAIMTGAASDTEAQEMYKEAVRRRKEREEEEGD